MYNCFLGGRPGPRLFGSTGAFSYMFPVYVREERQERERKKDLFVLPLLSSLCMAILPPPLRQQLHYRTYHVRGPANEGLLRFTM